jgi:hypothetical protein
VFGYLDQDKSQGTHTLYIGQLLHHIQYSLGFGTLLKVLEDIQYTHQHHQFLRIPDLGTLVKLLPQDYSLYLCQNILPLVHRLLYTIDRHNSLGGYSLYLRQNILPLVHRLLYTTHRGK